MFSLQRILVPTNLGEPSKAALRYGLEFASHFDARICLLHVLPADEFDAAIETERVIETLLPDTGEPGSMTADPSPEQVARNAAREDMRGLLGADAGDVERVDYLLASAGRHGPGHEIVTRARELDVQLIVMGKHRQGFVDHLLAGSVAEKVIREAPCPVLVVHFPENEFIVASEMS